MAKGEGEEVFFPTEGKGFHLDFPGIPLYRKIESDNFLVQYLGDLRVRVASNARWCRESCDCA